VIPTLYTPVRFWLTRLSCRKDAEKEVVAITHLRDKSFFEVVFELSVEGVLIAVRLDTIYRLRISAARQNGL
jgi:hypothetical protein